jgi:hypothetical protein
MCDVTVIPIPEDSAQIVIRERDGECQVDLEYPGADTFLLGVGATRHEALEDAIAMAMRIGLGLVGERDACSVNSMTVTRT